MKARRIFIVGNSGSGKSRLAQQLGLPHFDLDLVAWDPGPVRRNLETSLQDLEPFLSAHSEWVIEGCYADLVRALMRPEHHLIFLDLTPEVCLEHCSQRPWEPHKFPTPEMQQEALEPLLDWVASYPRRNDECSRQAHLQLYRDFVGKRTLCSTLESILKAKSLYGDSGNHDF